MSGGTASAKFDQVGKVYKGVIVRAEVQQQREIDTGELKTWKDGSPMLQIKVVLATDERAADEPDDNGERAIYLKGNSLVAVRNAVKKVGAKGLQIGGKLALKYTGDGEKTNKAFNAPKLYTAIYEAPDPMASVAASEPEAAPEDDGADLRF
jgi:hypothetical protein